MANIRMRSPNCMVRDLLTASLTRNYMALHSVHGVSSNAYRQRKAKPALPTNLMDAVIRKSVFLF